MIAAYNNAKKCARLLLSYGADKTLTCKAKNSWSYTAAQWCSIKGHTEVYELINSWTGDYDPWERPGQQMIIMIKRDRADQVARILDDGFDVEYIFCKVS